MISQRRLDSGFALRAPRNDYAGSPAPPVTRILHHVPVLGLFADVVFFVVAVALGGVDGNIRRAAGALVALVVLGNGLDGFWLPLCHRWSP
jgi:hypothetical protein